MRQERGAGPARLCLAAAQRAGLASRPACARPLATWPLTPGPPPRCVFQRPDDRNFIGVELSKDLGEPSRCGFRGAGTPGCTNPGATLMSAVVAAAGAEACCLRTVSSCRLGPYPRRHVPTLPSLAARLPVELPRQP